MLVFNEFSGDLPFLADHVIRLSSQCSRRDEVRTSDKDRGDRVFFSQSRDKWHQRFSEDLRRWISPIIQNETGSIDFGDRLRHRRLTQAIAAETKVDEI